jgi:hypothetical protein
MVIRPRLGLACKGELVSKTPVTDWRAWHSYYDDPDSSLARRLEIVTQRVSEALESVSCDDTIRVLSLCSGDGRDLLPVLASRQPGPYQATLVEKDPSIAADAVTRCRQLGLDRVTVVVGDAGTPSTYTEYLPVDLLLLCGIFGNISRDDIRTSVLAAPLMLRQGGFLIWTRGSSDPDVRSTIRGWVDQSGLVETSWDFESDGYGVGVARLTRASRNHELPRRLFTFTR